MVIISSQNQELRLYRSLSRKKNREKTGLIPLEGVRLIEEALRCKAVFQTIFYTEECMKHERSRNLLQLIKAQNPEANILNTAGTLLKEMSDTENPQGFLASVNKPKYELSEIMKAKNPLIVIVCGVQDPGNLGTIIRTASAASCAGVVITRGTVDAYNPKTLRAAMGAIFHLPVVSVKDIQGLISFLRYNKVNLAVTDLNGEINCYQADLTPPTALIFGSEAFGISAEIRGKADYCIKIPLIGPAESLNVSVSAGILIYEAVRQRHFSF